MKIKLSIAFVFTISNTLCAYTTLNFHDVYPPYSMRFHFNLMNEEQKEKLKILMLKELENKSV